MVYRSITARTKAPPALTLPPPAPPQGVAPSRRFALVPLGPPLLSYSSTCKVGRLGVRARAGRVGAPVSVGRLVHGLAPVRSRLKGA